ncbi:AUGMIN subunit 6-like [Phoenix dactylifera]|uniref:AUGMIN subunit 6-like n=1 Tax=Phoenix dactylifera TaxID=42345 RepID=A0A8B9AVU5_PHODC|nr:AUGMIN subunit 6-like [Phoenix dactylifera]
MVKAWVDKRNGAGSSLGAATLYNKSSNFKGQHENLASGPIEDLIAHGEHRYCISGTSLLAVMDLSSHVSYSDVLSVCTGEMSPHR